MLTWFKAEEAAGRLGDEIGSDYPFAETQQEAQFVITPQGVNTHAGDQVFKLASADRNWTVTLGSTFLTLDTVKYGDHQDFIRRLGIVFDALLATAPIPELARLGYRYTNRIADTEDLARLGDFFQAGILGTIADDDPSTLVHSASESVYDEDGGFLLVRTALLRANTSIDPGLAPVETESWVLDLDAYVESALPPLEARALAKTQANRARRRFRRLITDDFKERYR